MKHNELASLLGDFRLLLILFVSFRLLLLLGYQPFLFEGIERGVGTGGDRAYHYALSSLAADGLLPFRDWWSEFPPIWYLTTTGVYLVLGDNVTYDNWSLILGLVVILSEAGILFMMRAIGARLHGEVTGMALAWIYALLAAPAIFMWWNFDTLVTFFFLLGIWLLLLHRDAQSALAVAIGALTKFVPFLIFGALIRFFKPQRTLRYLALSVGLFVLAYLPLFAINDDLTRISVTAQFGKPSYQTVWAILDGNHTTGNFGTVESHLTPEGIADDVLERNPAVIPSLLRLVAAGAVGLFVFWRTKRFDEIGLLAFVGITLLIFYLQSQGWSPQWLSQIIPLVLLVFPTRNGVLLVVMLSILAFVEYPFIFVRTGNGIIDPASSLYRPWVLVVILRTLLLVGICVAYYRKLIQNPIPDLTVERRNNE